MKTLLLLVLAAASTPDWSDSYTLPPGGDRANVYELPPAELAAAVASGRRMAIYQYPVSVTNLMVPYRPVKELLENRHDLLKRLLGDLAGAATGIDTMDDLWERLALKPYPAHDGDDGIPFPPGAGAPENRIGVTLMEKDGATGFTFTCATCHLAQLFGRPVLGLTNKTTRANDFFLAGKTNIPLIDPTLFRVLSGATAAETTMLRRTRDHLKWTAVKEPSALGLDTSLAQVGRSLALRVDDAYATMTEASARNPRPNLLDHLVADSKPAVWWNVKYKTRWLSDGSIVSGNPVHTNILWNELGRSTDLRELEAWLAGNTGAVRDLTAAVFAAEAPRYREYYPGGTLDLALAQQGQKLFGEFCARCHGTYRKGWDEGAADPFATTQVIYHARTPVIDVGTDSGRREGTAGFADALNGLAISKAIATVVKVQQGYVPPPLVGIWARWPYFHNNMAPTLCAVLTRAADRPQRYYAGDPVDPRTDFDPACNGFPLGDAAPEAWRTDAALFDASKPGLASTGHDEGIFLEDGKELLSPEDKHAIIEFLKTL
jgi:mono/diheme cytochrome c family protein